MTREKLKELEEAAKPLMEFLKKNFNPHCRIIVESHSAEVVESVAGVHITEE